MGREWGVPYGGKWVYTYIHTYESEWSDGEIERETHQCLLRQQQVSRLLRAQLGRRRRAAGGQRERRLADEGVAAAAGDGEDDGAGEAGARTTSMLLREQDRRRRQPNAVHARERCQERAKSDGARILCTVKC